MKKQNDLFDQLAGQLKLVEPLAEREPKPARPDGLLDPDKAKLEQRKVSPELAPDHHNLVSLAESLRHEPKSSPDTSADQRQSLTGAEMVAFVNQQVPMNKRVLCLIVRDKVSRLNKAKSYFYPTYYLFIQTIVDVTAEESVPARDGQLLGQQSAQQQPEVDDDADDDDDLDRVENSFSASSSISADMLFIGAEGGAPATGNRSAGQQTGGKLATSYSDNEVCADPDLDEQVSDSGHPRRPNKRPANALEQERRRQPDTSDSDSLLNWPTGTLAEQPASSAIAEPDRMQTDRCERRQGEDRQQVAAFSLNGLFENDRNPFIGTYGVVLSGRKRKKTRT